MDSDEKPVCVVKRFRKRPPDTAAATPPVSASSNSESNFLSFVLIKSDDGTGLQAPSPGQVADELSDIAPRNLFDAA